MTALVVRDGGGITSCLSVRLHHVAAYHRQHEALPSSVDSSQQFEMYRDYDKQDVSAGLFGTYDPLAQVERTDYNHGWQFSWYDTLAAEKLSRMAQVVCTPSSSVGDAAYNFSRIVDGRTAVVYRGNDKAKEIESIPYDIMAEMARDCESSRFVIQTDEIEFDEYFRSKFPDTVRFMEIPQIHSDRDKYVIPALGNRARFAVQFFAAVIALGRAPKLLVTTGNVGLWCTLFHGGSRNVWQAHGETQRWRKLEERP